MMDFIEEIVLSKEEIKQEVERLGAQITSDYKDKNLLMVGILKGSVVFISDLMRKIKIPCKTDFMCVSSYTGSQSRGTVDVIKDISTDVSDYDVLVVEDILESGCTLSCLSKMIKSRGPKSFKICTLLDKPDMRREDVEADYVGRVIPNHFVVGYGLDYNELYRNLPFIGVLNKNYI